WQPGWQRFPWQTSPEQHCASVTHLDRGSGAAGLQRAFAAAGTTTMSDRTLSASAGTRKAKSTLRTAMDLTSCVVKPLACQLTTRLRPLRQRSGGEHR